MLGRVPIFLIGLAVSFTEWSACTSSLVSLSMEERSEIAKIAHEHPRVDIDIDFESRSAGIGLRSKAFVSLLALGSALAGNDLRNSVFIVAGHTAVEGNEIYNQVLSERRADTVKRFLVENFDIPPERLVAVGYGSTKLGDPPRETKELRSSIWARTIQGNTAFDRRP